MNYLFISFLLTVLTINLAPGPAMMFVLQQTQKHGVINGLMSAIGVEIGVLFYVILSTLGISVIFSKYPNIYFFIQVLGAVYLLYLAYLSWPNLTQHDATKQPYSKNSFLKGLFINLTNPKIVFFFISIIPQFIPKGSHMISFLMYGLIFNVGGIIVNISVALLSNQIAYFFKKVQWFDYVPPILFTAIALTTIATRFLL